MDIGALKTLNAERRARRAAILVTDLGDGSDRVVREQTRSPATLARRSPRRFAPAIPARSRPAGAAISSTSTCRSRAWW